MYSRLLVPLDGSSTANLALHHAAVLARLSGATIILLHIIEEMKHSNGFERPRIYLEEVRPGFLAAGQKLLDEAALWLRQEGLTVETVLLESKGERVSVLIAQRHWLPDASWWCWAPTDVGAWTGCCWEAMPSSSLGSHRFP